MKMSLTQVCSALFLVLFLSGESIAADAPYPEQTVVASRGSASVTMKDVDAALIGMPADQRANFMNSPKYDEVVELLKSQVDK